jgi:hypothetical protein
MNPYVKLSLKSVGIFIGALAVNWGALKAAGQISLIDWIAVLWPGILAVSAYWGGVADSTPAPWITPAQAQKTADTVAKEARP